MESADEQERRVEWEASERDVAFWNEQLRLAANHFSELRGEHERAIKRRTAAEIAMGFREPA